MTRPWLLISRFQNLSLKLLASDPCPGVSIDAGLSLTSSVHWPRVQFDQQSTVCREIFLTGPFDLCKIGGENIFVLTGT